MLRFLDTSSPSLFFSKKITLSSPFLFLPKTAFIYKSEKHFRDRSKFIGYLDQVWGRNRSEKVQGLVFLKSKMSYFPFFPTKSLHAIFFSKTQMYKYIKTTLMHWLYFHTPMNTHINLWIRSKMAFFWKMKYWLFKFSQEKSLATQLSFLLFQRERLMYTKHWKFEKKEGSEECLQEKREQTNISFV